MLYEVAVVEKPTKKQADEDGAVETLVMAPKAVVARDPQMAAIMATKGEALTERCEVLVRPFA